LYPISPHRIVADGSINRRSVEEQFLFWASQLNELGDYNIALRTIKREHLKLDSVQEMWGNRTEKFSSSPHPFNQYPKLTSSDLHIKSAPGGGYWLDWAINIKENSVVVQNNFIRIIPFANGQLLWRAADRLEHEWPLRWTGATYERLEEIPANDGAHSLSGQCHFYSDTGVFEVGLLAAADVRFATWAFAHYDGREAYVAVRRAV